MFTSNQFYRRCLNAVAGACAAILASASLANAQTSFYLASASDLAGPAGSIIRQEPIFGSPPGTTAARVLYRSTDPNGRPIAVSGIVILPTNSPVPAGGRPVVAWAHPTSGIVPHCAPSLAFFWFQQIQGARALLDQGYAIAATDYPGLGTPGPHPYLIGASEARSVIDSVRAARSLMGPDSSSNYAVWGHSQGGQAALFTGQMSRSYAPELRLVGVAAAAPATDLATLLKDDMNTTGGNNLTAMTLWSWTRIFNAPIDGIVAPGAMPAVDGLAQECIESVFDVLARAHTGQPLQHSFLTVPDLATLQPWKALLAQNSPGLLPKGLPVFIAQGTTDGLVRPAVTHNYVSRLCRNGSKVRFDILPNVGHGSAARDSAAAAVQWMVDRFQGQPAPSDCH